MSRCGGGAADPESTRQGSHPWVPRGGVPALLGRLCLLFFAGCSCSASVAESATVLEATLEVYAEASQPAAGVDPRQWESLRDAVLEHARELRARAAQ